jgi:hypothetical protein
LALLARVETAARTPSDAPFGAARLMLWHRRREATMRRERMERRQMWLTIVGFLTIFLVTASTVAFAGG